MIINCKQENIMGFNLIEIMIVLVILGIVFSIGGIFFISLWREHRISVQDYYLQREARYAVDFIINGQMEADPNEAYSYSRYGGIIASHDAISNEISKHLEEIELYQIDPNDPKKNILTGRIYPDPNGLWIVYGNNTRHRIIPTGSSEADIEDPYKITEMLYEKEKKDDSFINIKIKIKLEQNVYGRRLSAIIKSEARLRNYL